MVGIPTSAMAALLPASNAWRMRSAASVTSPFRRTGRAENPISSSLAYSPHQHGSDCAPENGSHRPGKAAKTFGGLTLPVLIEAQFGELSNLEPDRFGRDGMWKAKSASMCSLAAERVRLRERIDRFRIVASQRKEAQRCGNSLLQPWP